MTAKFPEGSLVWAKNPVEAWLPGTVVEEISNEKLRILYSSGKHGVAKGDDLLLRLTAFDGDISISPDVINEDSNDAVSDDLTKMTQLITPAVLHRLRSSYLEGKYYSKLGSGTVLALNPFRDIPDMFSLKTMRMYRSVSLTELHELPAHVYSVAQKALVMLRAAIGKVNQSIIVSGESGAGKTWTVRCLMRYLAEVGIDFHESNSTLHDQAITQNPELSSKESTVFNGQQHQNFNNMSSFNIPQESFNVNLNNNTLEASDGNNSNESIRIVDRIESRILHSNPILEAFGNAQTLRNENSSRFGKYIELQYGRSGDIVGAQLRTYLLEKTRVVSHDGGEKSYHIFYQMLHGGSDFEKELWMLPENPFPEDALEQEDINFCTHHCSDFLITKNSMKQIGISTETQHEIFKLLSAVLHLRQLTFEGSDDLQNASLLDHKNPQNVHRLKTASELLGVDKESIMQVITYREIKARSNSRRSVFFRPSTVEECYSRRDCLLKYIYEILFHWIVQSVGESICAPEGKVCSFLGLLDIYGFESFEHNSLEQLCINYANEKLQQHFVSNFLQGQQDEYSSENVEWTPCDLSDNVECLLALDAPRNSLFSLLNEECRLNRAHAGNQLKSRIVSSFEKSKHIILPRSTLAPSFSIAHYAGEVPYSTMDLIEKNKDDVPAEIFQLLHLSKNKFVYELMENLEMETITDDVVAKNTNEERPSKKKSPSKARHKPTVLTKFKESLDGLLDTLTTTDCHYIRCIKPNQQSVPNEFDAKFVLNQMEACGIVETIKVCSPAHLIKMPYNEFNARYSFLLRKSFVRQEVDICDHDEDYSLSMVGNAQCGRHERIVHVGGNKYNLKGKKHVQFGKTMIFLSSDFFGCLESSRSEEIVGCVAMIQSAWRNYDHRKKCRAARKALIRKREKSASIIQNAWRYIINLRKCRLERKVMIIQRKRSAILIENSWLEYKNRMELKKREALVLLKEVSATRIQSVFRGWHTRRKYMNLIDAWKQLKLLPEDERRRIIQSKLRVIVGPETFLHPVTYWNSEMGSPDGKNISASNYTGSEMSRKPVSPFSSGGRSVKQLIVHYDDPSPERDPKKTSIVDHDLEPSDGGDLSLSHRSSLYNHNLNDSSFLHSSKPYSQEAASTPISDRNGTKLDLCRSLYNIHVWSRGPIALIMGSRNSGASLRAPLAVIVFSDNTLSKVFSRSPYRPNYSSLNYSLNSISKSWSRYASDNFSRRNYARGQSGRCILKYCDVPPKFNLGGLHKIDIE